MASISSTTSTFDVQATTAGPFAGAQATATDTAQIYTTRMLSGMCELGHADAIALFGDGMEGASYLEACERSEAGRLRTSLIAVYRGDVVIAAAPVFRLEHRLDMVLGDRLLAVRNFIYRHAPRLISLPVACLGTRTSEECPIGFRSGLSKDESERAFALLLDGVARHTAREGVKIISLKDFSDRDTLWGHAPLGRAGFAQMPSPPLATLHLPFADEAAYLASLSANMRKSWKKRIKNFKNVEVEIRHSIEGIEDEVVELFEATKARSKTDYGEFSDVPAGFFREVVAAIGERAVIVLTRVDGVLASFSLSIDDGERLVGKYVGMRYPLAQEYDIYFLNWLTLVRYCIDQRIRWLQVGQTCYQQKVRLGCQLKRSWVYFRHTGAILGPLLRALAPRFAFDALDPDLEALGADAPYLPSDAPTGAPPSHVAADLARAA